MAEERRISCYWNAEDREAGFSDISDLIEAFSYNEVDADPPVFEVEHVAVIRTTFEASLPPASDADSDDEMTFSFPTREECEAAVQAEVLRRKTLTT